MKIDKLSDIFTKLTSDAGQRLQDINSVDNYGSDLIKNKYPHIWTPLVRMSYNWSLVGKYVLNNAAILKYWLTTQRDLSELFPDKAPMELRPGVNASDYKEAFRALHTYLETEVLPILEEIRPAPCPNEKVIPRAFGNKPPILKNDGLKNIIKDVIEAMNEDAPD